MINLGVTATIKIDPSTPFCALTYYTGLRARGCDPVVRNGGLYVSLNGSSESNLEKWAARHDPAGKLRIEHARKWGQGGEWPATRLLIPGSEAPAVYHPANDNRVQPRGLRRAEAARYLGISPSHFDTQRKAGNIPAPKQILGVALWDRQDLDRLFDGVSAANENDDYWDKACGNESLSS